MPRALRNIAIIAHVDHGKTTLVDKLLHQAGTFAAHQHIAERVMDSNDLEKERGITILAKNTAIDFEGVHINIVDTPGHADFGGEVERVLSMVDGVLLLVDAVEGPMPQTRFVTKKALALGLKPIVVVNKIDRDGARPDWVVNHTFDLMDKLGATEAQLDFPVVYASALNGWATMDLTQKPNDMRALFEAVLKYVPEPVGNPDEPLQLQISALDYSTYVGRIGIGRVRRGRIKGAQDVMLMVGGESGTRKKVRVNQVQGFQGLNKVPLEVAEAGEIVLITGIEDLAIGCTIADLEKPRQIRERLDKELLVNVALKVEETEDTDVFRVSGRGELHLTILLENMRREGFELAVGKPTVVYRDIDGVKCEPIEMLTVDVEDTHQGVVMEALGARKGDLVDMVPDGRGRVRLDYRIPARGLIGFQTDFMNMTRGTGLKSNVFDEYAPVRGDIASRRNGVLISAEKGDAVAYALWKLQDRGRMIVSPGDRLYEGMVIGLHSRDNDLVVNPIKGKQLTNVRSSGTDEAVALVPPIQITLESAIEMIEDDELVEITPKTIRIRKRFLLEHERKKASREAA